MLIKCPKCKGNFSVPDEYSGKIINCKICQNKIVAIPETNTSNPQHNSKSRERKIITVGLISAIILFTIGFCSGVMLTRPERNEIKSLRQHVRSLTIKLKERETVGLRDNRKLAQLYDNLHDYKQGNNDVKIKYIDSFEVRGNEITIKMQNHTSEKIGPDARILFLNKEGFITDDYILLWIISTIAPGETRIEKGKINFKFGEPVYYAIDFDP